ncbi:MAG: hypothetical protein WB586_30495 [Chthoniobacterales bacterium]
MNSQAVIREAAYRRVAQQAERKNFSKLPLFLRVEQSEHDSANLEAISWFSGCSCGSFQQIDAITRVRNLVFWGNKTEKLIKSQN